MIKTRFFDVFSLVLVVLAKSRWKNFLTPSQKNFLDLENFRDFHIFWPTEGVMVMDIADARIIYYVFLVI